MYIYNLNQEELSILISKAKSKAADWLFGKLNNVFILESGTLIFDNAGANELINNKLAGFAVASSAYDVIEVIRIITKEKNLRIEFE